MDVIEISSDCTDEDDCLVQIGINESKGSFVNFLLILSLFVLTAPIFVEWYSFFTECLKRYF